MKLTAKMTAFAACLIAMAGPALAGTFDLKLRVDVPPGVEPTPKNVKLAPLPAGKKLAVILYVDWSYRSGIPAVPLARSFSKAGWRATFFLAGTKDVAQHARVLEALGHEVATNLYSGGIVAYRDEMFSYSPQDILNAIGPLKSELTDDGKSWHAVPARRWPYHYGDFMTPLSNDHNAYTSTMRDEFRIYNRPLSVEEIQEHIKQVTTKAKKTD